MKPIIKVEKVAKQYRIGAQEASYQTLRDTIVGAVKSPLRRLRHRSASSTAEHVWALKDVSFEIEPGEVVGFIGRNGAGKSTLLKILSRITEPTIGQVELYGRIGSLLEVGTGFHPELTGRENLFLNGAILGMKREEIKRKFDEIVAFSEIEKFIDTPVKHYSSGMYLRLAFSVAVHLEPEILILDEVLAVGDSSFQTKCFNKMQEIRREGRTILFVSHNMQAITRLCKRAIYLSEGRVLDDGPATQVASRYLGSRLKISAERIWKDRQEAPGNQIARLLAIRVRTEDGQITDTLNIRQSVGIEVEFEVLEAGHKLVPNIAFHNEEDFLIFLVHDSDPAWRHKPRPAGRFVSTVWVPGDFFSEGTLKVGVAISTHDPVAVHAHEPDAVTFQVIDNLDPDSARGNYTGAIPGIIRPLLPWTTQFNARQEEVESSTFEEVPL